MADIATFQLNLMNAEGDPAEEPDASVAFRTTDQRAVVSAQHVAFPPVRQFAMPAWPQTGMVYCDITPSLYGMVKSGFFAPQANKQQSQSVTVLRLPDSWSPKFARLSMLPEGRFALLTKVLVNSATVDVKNGRMLGALAGAYDLLTADPERLAKMALLNLFAVLRDTREPVGDQNWFSFVQQIVRIDRERFVAEVSADLYTIVQKILGDLETYGPKGFFTESASMHYDNIPARYTLTSPLITVKIRYEQGNLQLTLGTAKTEGKDVVLLDCDMDEHSNIIEHAGDLFSHVFSGGTHPIDMHEYIVHHDPGVDLGYDLVPVGTALRFAARP